MSSQQLITDLKKHFEALKNSIDTCSDIKQLEKIKQEFLGKEGIITINAKKIASFSSEDKKEFGGEINRIKQSAHALVDDALKNFERSSQVETVRPFDVTAYKPEHNFGRLHPYTLVTQDIENIVMSMGFEIVYGNELENEFSNFESLNIPQDHPARETQDTFWVSLPGRVLRSHTTTEQSYALKNKKPPFAIISQGRTYRNEATDASHDFMFAQTDMILVGKQVSLANLKAISLEFFHGIFRRRDLNIRVRPGFFPFVEPGIEFDIQCPFCTHGCSTCKRSGWIELGGAGLIHPNVLTACGVDSNEYQGCAFGFGLTRLVMMKYGIPDIRLLHTNNLSFLEQFCGSPSLR
ncbi:MAG: Phenylalanine-tRNA ligase alpha subunit [candidate division TM6 bacterium GW2011_GWE2_41_16]|nr:MAG: Phenylalanine-tRNA ligase alpha subunit [candidate division TM6 bacterium GW2011_GWE2_41_16]